LALRIYSDFHESRVHIEGVIIQPILYIEEMGRITMRREVVAAVAAVALLGLMMGPASVSAAQSCVITAASFNAGSSYVTVPLEVAEANVISTGMTVSGAGIQTGTTVTSVDGVVIYISPSTTSEESGVTLTFCPAPPPTSTSSSSTTSSFSSASGVPQFPIPNLSAILLVALLLPVLAMMARARKSNAPVLSA
jgi:hypothetical protein